jgi:CubicO group peptidase (beta-lactamase class C family)
VQTSHTDRAGAHPEIPAVTAVVRASIARHEVSGAVTAVILPDRIAHMSVVGHADIEHGALMESDTVFWIASMTKPVIAVAIMMLQEDGKLAIGDAVERFIPEFKEMETPDGVRRRLTLWHLLTHTSGLAEATSDEMVKAKTLADIIPFYLAKALLFEPGTRWEYCQSAINTLGRIIEIVSGKVLPDFLEERVFRPLGMGDTSFHPSRKQLARLAIPYASIGGSLSPAHVERVYDPRLPHYPAANGGLYSTAVDYAKFCRLLLGRGLLDGKRLLREASIDEMTSVQTGDLVTGFTEGNGWGLGVCIVRKPQEVTAVLSPGTFGHGGAFGTQAWIDPTHRTAYLLMVQRSNFPNSDGSDLRKEFQSAAYASFR